LKSEAIGSEPLSVPASSEVDPQLQERLRSVDPVVFDIVLLSFASVIVFSALGLRPGSRLVPLVIGIPTVIALVAQTALDIFRFRHPVQEASVTGHDPLDLGFARLGEVVSAAVREEAEDTVLPTGEEARRRQLLFALWAVGLGVLATLTTFYLAAPIGLFAILLAVGRSPIKALLVTGGVLAFLYLTFDLLLNVPF